MKELPDRLLSPTEGAAFLGVSVDTLRRQVREKRYPRIPVGARRWAVRMSDLLKPPADDTQPTAA